MLGCPQQAGESACASFFGFFGGLFGVGLFGRRFFPIGFLVIGFFSVGLGFAWLGLVGGRFDVGGVFHARPRADFVGDDEMQAGGKLDVLNGLAVESDLGFRFNENFCQRQACARGGLGLWRVGKGSRLR